MSLTLRELGKTGVKIPVIGFGCMVQYVHNNFQNQ